MRVLSRILLIFLATFVLTYILALGIGIGYTFSAPQTKIVTKFQKVTQYVPIIKYKTIKHIVFKDTINIAMPKHLKDAEALGNEHKIHRAHQGTTYGYGIDLKASPDLGIPALTFAGVTKSRLKQLIKGIGSLSKAEIEKASTYIYILKRQKLERLIQTYAKSHLYSYDPQLKKILINLIYKGDIRYTKLSTIKMNIHYWLWYALMTNNKGPLLLFLKADKCKETKRVLRRLKRAGLV